MTDSEMRELFEEYLKVRTEFEELAEKLKAVKAAHDATQTKMWKLERDLAVELGYSAEDR